MQPEPRDKTPISAGGGRRNFAARERAAWIAIGIVWLGVYVAGFLSSGHRPDWEEAYNGNLATRLVDGLPGPVSCYGYGPSPGTLVYGALLTAPVFLTGSHALWIKVVGACFIGSGVFFWTALLRRVWGFQAAALFLTMMTFPSALFLRHSHIFFANHAETIFFSGLVYLLAFPKGNGPPSWPRTAALGLMAGFGAFFCYQNIAAPIAAAFLFPWRWGRRGLTRLVVFAGLAAGSAYAWMGFKLPLYLLARGGHFSLQSAIKWLDLLAENLFSLKVDRPPVWGFSECLSPVLAGVAFVCLLGGAAQSLRCNANTSERRPENLLAPTLTIQAVIWFAAATISNLWAGERYVLSLYPVVIAGVAYRASQLRARHGWLMIAPFLLVGVLAGQSVAPHTIAEARENVRALWDRRGDELKDAVQCIARTAVDDDEIFAAKLPPQWRDYAWVAMGRSTPPAQWAQTVRAARWTERERRLLAFGEGAEMQPIVKTYFNFSMSDEEKRQGAERLKEKTTVSRLLDRNAAASFVAGIGYAVMAVAVPEPTVCPREPMLDVRPLVGMLPQLSAPEFAAAFLSGAAVHFGEREAGIPDKLIAQLVAYWATAFGVVGGPDLEAVFRTGLNNGFAMAIINNYNRFKYIYRPADLPLLREALQSLGMALRPAKDDPNYFTLEKLADRKP